MTLSIEESQPTRLRAARLQIARLHPDKAGTISIPEASLFLALRRRIEAANSSPVQLSELAWSLNTREILWLVSGLEQWEDLSDPVIYILRERARPSLARHLWLTWQRRPRLESLSALLLDIGDQFGWDDIVGPAYAKRAREWVESQHPGRAIQSWLDEQGLSYSELSEIMNSPLRTDTPLTHLVREAVLTQGTTAQLRAEGSERLRKWLPELAPGERHQFGQNYLIKLPAAEWDPPILTELERSYGLPRNPRVASFWEPLPMEVRRAFQRYFIKRRLRAALEDDERYEYWMRWADEMVDVKFADAGKTPYGAFDFGTFGVVEFFEYGNAAYFYPPEEFVRITRGRAKHPSELKVLMTIFDGTNRITRAGNWQPRADAMMRRWLQATRSSHRE